MMRKPLPVYRLVYLAHGLPLKLEDISPGKSARRATGPGIEPTTIALCAQVVRARQNPMS